MTRGCGLAVNEPALVDSNATAPAAAMPRTLKQLTVLIINSFYDPDNYDKAVKINTPVLGQPTIVIS
jgi:hypothetical protein